MRPLTVVMSPHTMEIGGSQLNAVDLAARLHERGHRVLVHGPRGPLVDRVTGAGLPFVPETPSRLSPGPATARGLRELVRAERVDVVHGFEWPPILEAAAATQGTGAVAVGTVMSMGVAPFLPGVVPLTVGTREILDRTPPRSAPVRLWEPPVDTEHNRPGEGEAEFRERYGGGDTFDVVVVSRLVPELKLEGILTACRVVGSLARERRVRLLVVGDGTSREQVADCAAKANAAAGWAAVVMTGELPDPRGAYASADVVLGMGGSALRGLAFAKPLVVQGEGGFFEVLSPATVDRFLEAGWYGLADRSAAQAELHLAALLTGLADDADGRDRLAQYGRGLVCGRFGLDVAAAAIEDFYLDALRNPAPPVRQWLSGARSAAGLVGYKVRRRRQRRQGKVATDDFNARAR